ncbi:zinc finger, C4 type [Cooperia oncophora]
MPRGYNFNVITCKPCSHFFRRYALRPEKFKCPNNGQCVINVATRNSCRKCRLQKCFLVGMTPDGGISPNRDRVRKPISSSVSFVTAEICK